MHPNPAFRTRNRDENLAFAAQRSFGILAVNGAKGPLFAHVPFLIEEGRVWLHLVRSNPIARLLTAPMAAGIAVSGPDSYVSPDWYGVADQVPTWNYVAVHLRGTLARRPDEEMRDLLDRQSALFETRLHPKRPWTTGKMTPDVRDRMMRAILPCALDILEVDGTWKLNQNKEEAARLRAAGEVEAAGLGVETAALAGLMRQV